MLFKDSSFLSHVEGERVVLKLNSDTEVFFGNNNKFEIWFYLYDFIVVICYKYIGKIIENRSNWVYGCFNPTYHI
jgi:hypothetical protein